MSKSLFSIIRSLAPSPSAPQAEPTFWHEKDRTFLDFYDQSVRQTGSEDQRQPFPHRLYNTLQAFCSVAERDGWIAECGCFRGLSAHLISSHQRHFKKDFDGEGFQLFDSFAGLSAPTAEDMVGLEEGLQGGTRSCKAGAFAASLDHVRRSLQEFPKIEFHPGWLPESLNPGLGKAYKFVHIDLDIYVPIKGALEFFYPRLVPGGILVLDDYGFIRWPGARKATDEFCAARGLRPIVLSTGNAILLKAP
jgi:O-methyltransferase